MNESSAFAKQRLGSTSRAKDRAKRLAWGLLISATVLGILLAVALLDYWLALSANLRFAGLVLLVVLLATGLAGWFKLRGRPTSIKEAALDTEAHRSDLGCVVSTAAEYMSGERVITREYEPELVAALEQQAAKNLETADISYSNRLLAPAVFLAFALLTLLVFAALAPVAFTAFKRTVAPWSGETYTQVRVWPGNADIPVGGDLDVTNIFSGRVPKDPAIHWQEFEKTNWESIALQRADDGTCMYSFKKLQNSVHYRVTGNDAVSETYEVTTYVPPEVRAVRLDISYPAYTRVAPFYKQTPDATVLRASELTLRITASTKLSKARIRFSNQPGIELTPSENEEWTTGFKAVTNVDYWIELADAKGHKGGNEQPHHLKVVPDKPPKVDILEPAHDMRAEATNTIPIKIAGSDDFGLNGIKLVYHRLGGPDQVLPCIFTNTSRDEVMGGVELALASLNLKEYELVAYHAEALDNNTLDGPGKGVSSVYFIEITNEESGDPSKAKAKTESQNMNLLAIQKQIIADTSALAAKEPPEKFAGLASRQKEATAFAQTYRDSMAQLGAPEEAVKLMEDALREMKSASGELANQKRDAALPPEEKALADLYQVLKLQPKLDNLPTQVPPNQQNEQEPVVSVALNAIKKQKKKEPPSDEEIAKALVEAKQLDRAQGEMLLALERNGQPAQNDGPPGDQPGTGAKTGKENQEKQGNKEANPNSEKKSQSGQKDGQPGTGPRAGKQNPEERAKTDPQPKSESDSREDKNGEKSNEGKQDQGKQQEAKSDPDKAQSESKKDAQNPSGKNGQQANAANKAQGQGEQQGKAGAKAGGGKHANSEPQPNAENQENDPEKLADLEDELSKEAAALAEKLEKIAVKDSRLGHTAAKKASQAAGQMGAAAQALRQGNRGAAGTEGGQGLMNLDKLIATLERAMRDQPTLTDVATEDFPKEYDTLISEYLRKLSHEK